MRGADGGWGASGSFWWHCFRFGVECVRCLEAGGMVGEVG